MSLQRYDTLQTTWSLYGDITDYISAWTMVAYTNT